MELLLIGWVLGVSTCTAHQYFVVRPKLKSVIAELRRLRHDL